MANITELEKEVEKTREYLKSLEQKLHKTKMGYMSEKERMKQVKAELKAKYPEANPDRELLAMVGTLTKPAIRYKEALRQIVAERYTR